MRSQALLALLCCGACQAHPGAEPEAPAYSYREHAAPYAGDGAEASEDRIGIDLPLGWFGPDDPSDPLGGGLWSAACMAVEDVGTTGTGEGKPLRLVPVWSPDPWGSGVRLVTRLVYDDGVLALAGAPDSASAHLVEQVTAKARLAFVSAVSTEESANLAGVPWIFSCAPDDHQFAPLLAGELVAAAQGGAIALVSATDHGSRRLARDLSDALVDRGAWTELHLELSAGRTDLEEPLARLRSASPAAIALVAGPLDSAAWLRALRAAGFEQPVIGGPALGRRAFRDAAGAAAEGVRFPLLWDPAAVGERAADFARRFEARTTCEPDAADALAYDAVRLIAAAIERAGPNRVRIGEALRALAPYEGVSGRIEWDRTGQCTRAVPLGTWRNGERVRVSG